MSQTLHPLVRALLAALAPETPELASPEGSYLEQLRKAAGSELCAAYRMALEARTEDPLLRLGGALGLSGDELACVAVAVAVEREAWVGRLIAYLQHPTGGSRPTLGLLARALSVLDETREVSPDFLADSLAVRTGLLCVTQDGLPTPELSVFVPVHLVNALQGRAAGRAGYRVGLAASVPLPLSFVGLARKHAAALLRAPQRALLIRAGVLSEGRSAAVAVCAALGRAPLFIETEDLTGLVPWLLLERLCPVFVRWLSPGEHALIPELVAYRGPTLIVCGPEGTVELGDQPALSLRVPVPNETERAFLWTAALGPGEQDNQAAATLAREHRHGPGRIAELGALARHRAAVDGREAVSLADVVGVASQSGMGRLGGLAEPIRWDVADDVLVLPQATHKELELLLTRCRQRESLVVGLGAAARTRYTPGVRALLVGPSGTGKTLAASWLATRLRAPLYRVDIASVTSKYIGETEKNLSELLARAEHAEVILLFDEADSLFGKRTDIKQSTDRFANSQTNYLLQRIEAYEGVILLTSNSRARFDSAFARRLDSIVEFPSPGPEQRRALWLAHLGSEHALEQVRLNWLAVTVELSGGHIRNAVLTAAMLARHECRPIAWPDLERGVSSELRKLGLPMPVLQQDRQAGGF